MKLLLVSALVALALCQARIVETAPQWNGWNGYNAGWNGWNNWNNWPATETIIEAPVATNWNPAWGAAYNPTWGQGWNQPAWGGVAPAWGGVRPAWEGQWPGAWNNNRVWAAPAAANSTKN